MKRSPIGSTMEKNLLPVLLLVLSSCVSPVNSWIQQTLPQPASSNGFHNGVAMYDMNDDGVNDIIVCGGTSSSQVEQPYILMNLGSVDGTFFFSDPLEFGTAGIYSKCEATWLEDQAAYAVLMVGTECADNCLPSAKLIRVEVTGCNFYDPSGPCSHTWSEMWSRGGISVNEFIDASFLDYTNGVSPALIVAARLNVMVFESNGLSYPVNPTLNVNLAYASASGPGTSISVGWIGDNPGFIAGYGMSDGTGTIIAVARGTDGAYTQTPLDSTSVPASVVLGDIDGDDYFDAVTVAYGSQFPQTESYYLLGTTIAHSFQADMMTVDSQVTKVDLSFLFEESEQADAIYAMDNGDLMILKNMGNEDNNGVAGNFLGFQLNETLSVPSDCVVNDIFAQSMWPCTVSIAVATTCTSSQGIQLFSKETCDFEEWLQNLSPSAPSAPSSPSYGSPSAPSASVSTASPTITGHPTSSPSYSPSGKPSASPSLRPSSMPSDMPSLVPSMRPSGAPSVSPTSIPSESPSSKPSSGPSQQPSLLPSLAPTSAAPTRLSEASFFKNQNGDSSEESSKNLQLLIAIIGGTAFLIGGLAYKFRHLFRRKSSLPNAMLPDDRTGPALETVELMYEMEEEEEDAKSRVTEEGSVSMWSYPAKDQRDTDSSSSGSHNRSSSSQDSYTGANREGSWEATENGRESRSGSNNGGSRRSGGSSRSGRRSRGERIGRRSKRSRSASSRSSRNSYTCGPFT